MKPIPTLLRLAEHDALSRISLSGSVIDIGGDAHAEYRNVIRGEFTVQTVNLDPNTSPDIAHDLETPLPCAADSFDNALLINVLEHIYRSRELLGEAIRIVRPGGKVVIIVPFLFPLHEDPHDFWRYSRETLERMCADAGLNLVHVTALGSGVFAARYVMLDRLMPYPIRFISFYTFRYVAVIADAVFSRIDRAFGKKYDPADYALGYVVQARV